MPGATFISGDRIDLRTVEADDYAFVRRHANDHRVRDWIGGNEPNDPDDVEAWIEAADAIGFIPVVDDEPVGYVWLFRIERSARRAEIGYWIAPEFQGQGYGSEAAKLIVDYAFDDLNCHRVTARVYEGNEPSSRILESLGFQHEGCLRERGYADGEYLDCDLYGLLAAEY